MRPAVRPPRNPTPITAEESTYERGLPSESSTPRRQPRKGRGACERPAGGDGMSAASAMLKSEARLLARNPGVVVWAAIPAVRQPMDGLGGLSFFAVYQPVLVLFAVTLLAVQAMPDVLTRYREMGVLKRLRTTPVSPAVLLFAHLALILAVSLGCMLVMVIVPALIGATWPQNIAGFLLGYLLAAWALLGVGMVIASLFRNAKVAAGFGTLLFFVLQFFAGLWLQRPLMPDWLRHISDFTPSGAAAQALT